MADEGLEVTLRATLSVIPLLLRDDGFHATL
jgi:hypothetical protein